MDTIKEYLDNLFLGFPETPAVLRAKAELLEMMEDKYEECLEEGKSEKEAVGIVISEFGNIEEIAEELGIADVLPKKEEDASGTEEDAQKGTERSFAEDKSGFQSSGSNGVHGMSGQNIAKETWSFSQAHQYVSYAWKHGLMIGAGVACFILSCFLSSVMDIIRDYTFLPTFLFGFFDHFTFMGGVAAGVLILIFAGRLERTYPVVKKKRLVFVDTETADYMKKQWALDEEKCFRMRLVGILLLVFMWVPAASADIVFRLFPVLEELADNSTLLMIAVGVCLIIVSASVGNRYEEFAKAAVISEEYDGYQENGFSQDAGFGEEQSTSGNWQNGSAGNQVFAGYQKKKRGWVPAVIIIAVVLTMIGLAIRVARLVYVGIDRAGQAIVSEITDGDEKETVQHGSYAPADVNDIQMDLDTEDILVQSGDTETITMDYQGTGKIKETLNNGVLELKERGKGGWFHLHFRDFFSKEHGSLVLTLPKSLYGSVESFDGGVKISIDTDTGDVQMKEVCFSKVSIDVDTGNVSLSDVAGVENGVSIDADTGNVQLNDVAGGKITVDADTGDVTVNVSTARMLFGGLDCDLDTGDFLLKLPMSKEGFLETFATDFSSDLDKQIRFFGEKIRAAEVSGKRQGEEKLVKVSTDVGSITIEGNK